MTHSTAQHSTAQHSTAQHSTAQHSTAQHSTVDIIIVTAVWNAERTLRLCVDSVLQQTYPHFEYHLIDNGSKDASRAIIAEYATQDKRVIPHYNETNTFPFTVHEFCEEYIRNNDTTGKYFCILDNDDAYEATFFEEMLMLIEQNNLAIAICSTQMIKFETGELMDYTENQVKSDILIAGNDFSRRFTSYIPFLQTYWAKLFKFDLLRLCDFSSTRAYPYMADTVFCYEVFKQCYKHKLTAGISNRVLHYYAVRQSSGVHGYLEEVYANPSILFDRFIDFLTAIEGSNAANMAFLHESVLDILSRCVDTTLNGNLTANARILRLTEIFSAECVRDALANPKVAAQVKADVCKQVADMVFADESVASNATPEFMSAFRAITDTIKRLA